MSYRSIVVLAAASVAAALTAASPASAASYSCTSSAVRGQVLTAPPIEECDGTVGTVCVYQASSPEAIRTHAAAAELPVDEIVRVAGTEVERLDPIPAAP